ncbi:MAG TPA: hypothetical protein PKK78_18455 [Kouleothrix sp.]|jgi:hypothetical protein|nr:hypothetical protein [Kouleothrix sp.]
MPPESLQACCWCGAEDSSDLIDFDVQVANAQVDFDHAIYRCSVCTKLSATAQWGSQKFAYKALEYPRTLRKPIYVLVYDIACAWCGRSDAIEPADVNATIGNPASARHRYDIYACNACQRYTAVSYLGQVFTYPATQDTRYPSMYYLEVGDE